MEEGEGDVLSLFKKAPWLAVDKPDLVPLDHSSQVSL